MAYLRTVTPLRNCGTTSRTASNISNSKTASSNWTKINSETFLDLVWKSISFASTVLKPLASYGIKTDNPPQIAEKLLKGVPHTVSVSSSSAESVLNSTVHSGEYNNSTENSSKLATEKNDKSYGYLEDAFWEWISGSKLQEQKKKFLDKEKKIDTNFKPTISKTSLQQRSRFLVRSLNTATSRSSQFLRLEEICKHLLIYPAEKSAMVKDGLLRNVLWLRQKTTRDDAMLAQIQITLSMLGYQDPPKGNGIRILSIDGGGTRGMMAIEILRQLEERTNKKVYELFDYFCGVSSGAILCLLLGGLRMTPNECEDLYQKLSVEVFNQSPFMGTSRLMWNHAYYDTTTWLTVLKSVFEERLLVDTANQKSSPKLAAISAIMNLPRLQAFVFRNYDFPLRAQSQYLGSCSHKMWEAIRASGAAPGYFEEFPLNDYLHQDGGVLINNPTAVAIHESRLLWPSERIQCVISLGSGRYSPMTNVTPLSSTSIKTKMMKIIDSATDTEGVHIALHDLLSSHTYFRLNPYLTEFLSLDENRPEKLQQLKNDAQMYLRRNEHKFNEAINALSKPRSQFRTVNDWFDLQKMLFL